MFELNSLITFKFWSLAWSFSRRFSDVLESLLRFDLLELAGLFELLPIIAFRKAVMLAAGSAVSVVCCSPPMHNLVKTNKIQVIVYLFLSAQLTV